MGLLRWCARALLFALLALVALIATGQLLPEPGPPRPVSWRPLAPTSLSTTDTTTTTTMSRPTLAALVIGATGATGKYLVCDLVRSPAVRRVTALVRRETQFDCQGGGGGGGGGEEVPGDHPGAGEHRAELVQRVVDFEKFEENGELFAEHDVLFSCLGTTRSKAGAEGFRHVDYDLLVAAARVARSRGVRMFSLMSSVGADANSWFLYPRTKGEAENAIAAMDYHRVSVFRPSVLTDRGADTKLVERLSAPLAGLFPGYRSISVRLVARAMLNDAVGVLSAPAGAAVDHLHIYENEPTRRVADGTDAPTLTTGAGGAAASGGGSAAGSGGSTASTA